MTRGAEFEQPEVLEQEIEIEPDKDPVREEKLQKIADLLSIRYIYKVVEWEEPFT